MGQGTKWQARSGARPQVCVETKKDQRCSRYAQVSFVLCLNKQRPYLYAEQVNHAVASPMAVPDCIVSPHGLETYEAHSCITMFTAEMLPDPRDSAGKFRIKRNPCLSLQTCRKDARTRSGCASNKPTGPRSVWQTQVQQTHAAPNLHIVRGSPQTR